MKLHQSLFLNIISFFGLTNLFTFLTQFSNITYKIFIYLRNISFVISLVMPIFLLLFIAEYIIVKLNKLQPIIKNDNKLFKVIFYINIVVAMSYTIFWYFVLYQFSY